MSDPVKALFEIEGTDVHPHTVDPRVAADLIKTFFDLLGRAATVRGVPLKLRGITIVDKCFQLGCDTYEPDFTIKAMEVVTGWVTGTEEPDSKKDRDLVRHLHTVITKFGDDAAAKISVGDWERSLDFTGSLPELPPQVTTTLRVKVLDVGVSPSRVKFESGSEDDPFSLEVTTELAEELGHFVNKELDLVFKHRRNRQGRIEDGEILEYFPMEVDDTGEGWLKWLTENGRHWSGVEDPLEELGRRGD